MYTIKEFAKLHNISRSGVEYAMREGRLKFKKEHGRRLLYANKGYSPILGRGRKPVKASK